MHKHQGRRPPIQLPPGSYDVAPNLRVDDLLAEEVAPMVPRLAVAVEEEEALLALQLSAPHRFQCHC